MTLISRAHFQIFCALGMISMSTLGFSRNPLPPTPLPNWFDPKLETSDGKAPELPTSSQKPSEFLRPSPEYETAQAVLMGFSGFEPMLREIARAVGTHTDAEVWALAGPASLDGLPAERYKKINCPIDSVWMRDYGPFATYRTNDDSGPAYAVGFSDAIYRHYSSRRNDDRVPSCTATAAGISSFAVPLIFDGGNFLVDSAGTLFMTTRTYSWNSGKTVAEVDAQLRQSYQVKAIHAIPYAGAPASPTDGTGHIDMYVKLMSDDSVVIAETSDTPYKNAITAAVDLFSSLKTPSGKPYTIVRVPGKIINGKWFTFTNSLIVNTALKNTVIVPTFAALREFEPIVRDAYQAASPGIEVVFVNSDASILSGGAIHCVTQLVPALNDRGY